MKIFIILFLAISSLSLKAEEILPLSLTENNTEYERCDAFTFRYGFIIKVVDVGWYAPACNELSLLESGNKILRFHYHKNVKADFFKESAEEYFILNLETEAQQHALIEPLKSFNAGYTDIQPGEYFQLVHTDDHRLSLFKNKQLLVSTDDVDLAKNYFNIWFGKTPVIEKLKKAFL